MTTVDGSAAPEEGLEVSVNGDHRTLPAGATVEDVVALVAETPKGIAVALNGEVVARSAWSETRAADGDRFEVLTAAQGG